MWWEWRERGYKDNGHVQPVYHFLTRESKEKLNLMRNIQFGGMYETPSRFSHRFSTEIEEKSEKRRKNLSLSHQSGFIKRGLDLLSGGFY